MLVRLQDIYTVKGWSRCFYVLTPAFRFTILCARQAQGQVRWDIYKGQT